MQNTVLVNKPIHPTALEKLKAEVAILTPYDAPLDEVLDLIPQVRGIILGIGLHMGPTEWDLARNLVILGRHGVGLDSVDLPAASERGIPVSYTPDGPTESTAEHALMLMLATARRLPYLDGAVRTGRFSLRLEASAMGYELKGKTVGVVGFGRIGQRFAAMCRDALHMPVLTYDPYLDTDFVRSWGATPINDLCEMAGKVDVLSIHVPLTSSTHHLLDKKVIRALKPGAIVINTSRGPVVDEAPLIDALFDGHLAGAGLDVFDPQPPAAGSPLYGLNQVVLTPHVASNTDEGRLRMGLTVVEDVLRALRGERPRYLANPDVWPSRRVLHA